MSSASVCACKHAFHAQGRAPTPRQGHENADAESGALLAPKLFVGLVQREFDATEVLLLVQRGLLMGWRACGSQVAQVQILSELAPPVLSAQPEESASEPAHAQPSGELDELDRAFSGVEDLHALTFSVVGVETSGVLQVIRAGQSPAFSSDQRCAIERMMPLLGVVLDNCKRAVDHECAQLVHGTLDPGQGAACLYDRAAGRLIWTDSREAQARAPALEHMLGALLQSPAARTALAGASPHGGCVIRLAEVARRGASQLFAARVLLTRVNERLPGRASRRESEVAHLLVQGHAAINIAAILGISEPTVRTYIRRLYRKFEVSTRADFVRTMLAMNLVSDPDTSAPGGCQPEGAGRQ